MRTPTWVLLALTSGIALPPLLLAGDSGGRAHYIGGTVTALPSPSEGSIHTTDEEFFLFRTKSDAAEPSLRVPYGKIRNIEYGQRVNRRYISAILISPLMLLAKKRRHYLTVGYTDQEGRPQALVFEVSKGAVRSVLVSLEAKTGLRVEFQDEEARKAGKG